MKLVLILTTMASLSTGQLVYPDEYESLVAAITSGPQKYSSFATSISNTVPNTGNNMNTFSRPITPQAAQQSFPQAPPSNSQANNVISKGVLRFALNMDDAVAVARTRFVPKSRENVVFSPLSVAAALALVLLGSGGTTFDEVSKVLGLNNGLDITENSEAVHRMFGNLIAAVSSQPGLPGLPETSFASGIFVQDGYPIRREYKTASESIYKSEVANLNYRNGASAERRLNAWVNEKTRGKIPSIVNGPPPAETNVIITSALYFKGEWNQHFIEGATRSKTFTIAPGETVDVNMMYNGGEFPFFEDKQLRTKIVGLPYKGHEVTMYVVLPTDSGYEGLRRLEQRLNPEILENLIRNMENRSCIIGLPRMKLSSTLSLRGALQSLGLNSLFDPSTADLSLISTGGRGQPSVTPTLQTPSTGPIKFPNRGSFEIENPRLNFFQYDDKVRGYHVEQWATGFSIERIAKLRRRRSFEAHKSRVKKDAVLPDVEKRSKTEGGRVLGEKSVRNRRQAAQQFNQNFSNDLGNQYQASYGLDYLRRNGVLKNPEIYADDVLHRVDIDVTEKGTEAAAATAVVITKDGNQKRLVADHPFLFFIRHEPTGLILFWGSVIDPTSGSSSPPTAR